MSIATVGGTLLIIGAFFTYRGNIFLSILIYFTADICWLMISLSTGDYFGSCLVLIGMLLGIGVYIKMNKGEFVKNLKKEYNKR